MNEKKELVFDNITIPEHGIGHRVFFSYEVPENGRTYWIDFVVRSLCGDGDGKAFLPYPIGSEEDKNTQIDFEGSIKWDGCAHINYIHLCGIHTLEAMYGTLKLIYKHGKEIMGEDCK